MPDTRRLDWEALLNARDLGGIPTADGRETRQGALVRSDSFGSLTASGREAVIGYGIRTVIDLRLPDETGYDPNPFAQADGHGIAYRNVSFFDPAATPPSDRRTLADDYKGMLRRYGPQVAQVVTAIATAGDGGVVIHCAAGKDRTGLITALVLASIGVSRDAIADDYGLTAESLKPREAEWVAEARSADERSEREAALRWSEARSEVMHEVLGHVDEQYGGADRYLLQAGVDPADLDRLRVRLLDPGPSRG